MTRAFHQFLEGHELSEREQADFRVDRQFLSPNSLVKPGRYIFELFAKGTQCKHSLFKAMYRCSSVPGQSRTGSQGLKHL
jgi:hypothetical protein